MLAIQIPQLQPSHYWLIHFLFNVYSICYKH